MHAAHLIDLGVRLGLFERLAATANGMGSEALATDAGLNATYVDRWCDTACALELLDYDPSSGYRLAPHMDQILGQPDGTFYLGGFPQTHFILSRDYALLPGLYESGAIVAYQDHDDIFLRGVADVTRVLPRMFLGAILPKLPALQATLERGAHVLDVGCGGGHAIVTLAERFPRSRCVGVDVEPISIGLANDLIRDRGVEDRASARLIDGSSLPAEFVGAFDLVCQFLVLHEIRPELKSAVMAQCAQALRPGGSLFLFDERYPSSPGELRDPTQIYAVMAQWYESHWGNIVNTREEIGDLITEQGLKIVDETELSRFYIVTAEKPVE